MTKEKKQLLDTTFQTFMEVGFRQENLSLLNEIVAKDVVGFGTAIDEKLFGVKELQNLLLRQKQQGAGMEMHWKINTLDIHISADENTAIYTNEILLYVTVEGNPIEMYMRFSVVLEYVEQKWMVVHWHGSKPEHVESEKDTWGIQTWKEKAEALEKEVALRTADLVEKNKELQVEAALERVRAISLAMHNTNELQRVIHAVHQELLKLNLSISGGSFIAINSEIDDEIHCWGAGGTAETSDEVHIPRFEKPFYTNLLRGIRKGPGFFTEAYTQQEKIEFFTFLFGHEPWSKLDAKQKEATLSAPGGYTRSCTVSNHTSIFIINHSGEIFSEVENEILKRFGKVFEQAYTRFIDLQKAETQAKEAQIEAALERVRSKTMAMHNSNDVGESVATLFDELIALGLLSSLDRCGIGIMQPNEMMELWTAEKGTGKTELTIGHLNMQLHTLLKNVYQNWLDKKETYQYILQGEDKFRYYEAMRNQANYKIRKDYYSSQERIVHTDFFFKEGCLYVFSQNAFTPEATSIFIRFVNVFGQTYRRYLDLQKAEAQACEAQIEVALERVRAASMAMHKSEELHDVIKVVASQIKELGINYNSANFTRINEDKSWNFWVATPEQPYPSQIHVPYFETRLMRRMYEIKNENEDALSEVYSKEVKDHFFHHFYENTIARKIPDDRKNYVFSTPGMCISSLVTSNIVLNVARYECTPFTEDENLIFSRFARVFEQTYTRFLDLQKAEAQAREARIEAALERVRSKSLAMHKSTELHEVVNTLYGEFTQLDINFNVVVIQLLKDSTRDLHLWISTSDGLYDNIIHWPYVDMRHFNELYAASSTGSPLSIILDEEETHAFFDEYFKLADVPQGRKEATKAVRQINIMGYYQKNTGIFLMRYTEGAYSLHEKDIIQRFSKVFEQTYTRFLDLQKAEALALDAIKRASVDRVRAEIASMRTTSDLERIQPLIWNELKIIGVPFIRCGVFIMDDAKQEVQAFLSTPDGKSIAAFHLPYHSTEQSKHIVAHWQQKKVFRDHMDEAAFVEYTKNLVLQGAVASDEKYVTDNRPTDLYLHFLPFLQGMLYVGNDAPMSEEELQLVQNLADAFSTAYARYEDFNKLEAAKIEVDEALQELKLTQDQLIQAEKLASLGQLTAGIAHEIKNPLNFINNFSDVSIELIDEVLAEILQSNDSGTKNEIVEILNSVKSNLNIIHQHGARADGIVKSMLMHSRGSTGNKEPTDLNAMVRENVNLAFHAMRASKHPINVETVLHLDDQIGEVPLIIEDFSRVILNLCNNAMDAMREKAGRYEVQSMKYESAANIGIEAYKPKLNVRTGRIADQVFIEVEDNGPGIAAEIRDKILQPFFTTKKGTQGTGLGLSITHDIIKAHGGTLEIETELGTYSKFIITLI